MTEEKAPPATKSYEQLLREKLRAMADEEEQDCCPLCMEELDITDKTFDACPCGYQVRSCD